MFFHPDNELSSNFTTQLIYKVDYDYDMGRFTEIYSLKNNYIWNYHTPLLTWLGVVSPIVASATDMAVVGATTE